MKTTNTLQLLVVFAFCLSGQIAFGQSPIVKDVTVNPNEAHIEFNAEQPVTYLVEISGPQDYYHRQEVAKTTDLRLSPEKPDGSAFANGNYSIQLTPIYQLTEEQKNTLITFRQQNDLAAIQTYREANNLPTQAEGFVVNFGIHNGHFVSPTKHEGDMPPPTMFGKQDNFHAAEAIYASLNYIEVNLPSQTKDNTFFSQADDQVFLDDVIIDGSLCVGQDCVNGESFGFDTQRIKENNLRIHFDDTSASASFPSNDWRIAINDSSNGGASYFAVEDATAGNTPFKIAAGAGNNAVYVNNNGNVGLGTASPVVELQVTDGDTPTMRLEQNGSSGFGSQTWDVAGNETNFFIRDATNGSSLPFRIRPSAPQNSIFIDADGDIGLGDESPDAALDIESGDLLVTSGNVTVSAGNLGINKTPTVALDVLGVSKFEGTTVYTGDVSYILTNGVSFLGAGFQTPLRVDAVNNFVGIGTPAPGHLLELGADDAVKPGGGSWAAPSDRRLKTNINDFNDGLEKVLQVRPVTFNYNGKLGYPTDKEFIGVIAQEMQEVAPYTVKDLNHSREEEDYLAFDPASLTYLLINAVQEQQEMIDTQKEEIAELQSTLASYSELQSQVDALTRMVAALNNNEESSDTSTEEVIGDKK